jgi:hypothetical protein
LHFRCLHGPGLAAFRPEANAVFHPDTQFLIDHWTGLARAGAVRGGIPSRGALRPEAFGRRLPRAFLADRRDGRSVLTLAGTGLETVWRRPLAGQDLTDLWTAGSVDLVEQAVAQAVREARPVVVAAMTDAEPALALEMVVAPLRGASERPDRVLGLFAPTTALTAGAEAPRLIARVAVAAGSPGRPALSLAAVEGRRIA